LGNGIEGHGHLNILQVRIQAGGDVETNLHIILIALVVIAIARRNAPVIGIFNLEKFLKRNLYHNCK